MATSPAVVLVIPAFNVAATIGDTLDAVQKNSALDRVARVVLLNDCSSDDTVAIARRHWFSSVPFEVWENAENYGERRTTNAAIVRVANKYDWTFILHADDVVKPNWLRLYLSELDQVPDDVASICSSYDNWWPDTGKIEPGEEFPDRPAVYVAGERASVLGTLDNGCWWHLSGCGIRNAHFLDIGGFAPEMPQLGDWEWLLRCLSRGYGIWYLPRSTMLYRQHGSSVSSQSFREARDMKEQLHILNLMQVQGYISEADHRARLLRCVQQVARRMLVRGVRGDIYGFCSHSSLLFNTVVAYMHGRL